jgi:hypothetical protein
MDILRAIPEFIWTVLKSWQGYLTGGILVALSTVWERYHNRSIPWSKYKWGVICFLLVSFFSAWYEQRQIATHEHESLLLQTATFDKEKTLLSTALENSKNNLNVSSSSFQNGIGLLRAFMSYRRALGPDTACRMLVTAQEDSADLVGVVVALAVVGSNCPNGNLQNIGVKPEDVDKESMNGMIPGTIVLHALPNTKGADRLVDDLSNIIQTRRSYKLPRPVKLSQNIIWLQVGTGTKWNSQLP